MGVTAGALYDKGQAWWTLFNYVRICGWTLNYLTPYFWWISVRLYLARLVDRCPEQLPSSPMFILVFPWLWSEPGSQQILVGGDIFSLLYYAPYFTQPKAHHFCSYPNIDSIKYHLPPAWTKNELEGKKEHFF